MQKKPVADIEMLKRGNKWELNAQKKAKRLGAKRSRPTRIPNKGQLVRGNMGQTTTGLANERGQKGGSECKKVSLWCPKGHFGGEEVGHTQMLR